MFRSPNKDMKYKDNKIFNPYQLGENQIAKRFQYALSALLTSEYYEGTDLGKIYNERRADGRSKIYVDQPELEARIYKEFIDLEGDVTKFLVGYTGVGKTTLIRNIFQVFDRKISEKDGNLVIYFSLYSMMPAIHGGINNAVQNGIISALEMATTYLSGSSYAERLLSYDEKYYKELFYYINENNESFIHNYRNSPKYTEKLDKENIYMRILNWLEEEDPLDYALSQFKFYLKRSNKQFKNIILIFDDIEAKSIEYHNELIELSWHIKKCLQAYKDRNYTFKILITLRNYSFRMQQIRLKEAFREIDKNDIILKDSVPNLSKVLDVRLNYILSHKNILSKVKERDTWKIAAKNLNIILNKLYGQYDQMLLALTHNDIFKSMKLLMRIVTNKKHLGKYEIFNNGAFIIEPQRYSFRNYLYDQTMPGNDDVFYSLVYGEAEGYQDIGDYYLSNIMHYKKVEGVETELFGIYIIQFLINEKIYMGNTEYDGFKTKEGGEIVETILNIFDLCNDNEKELMNRGIRAMMKKLYEGGVLLQSIIEPKREDGNSFSREYSDDLQVYLSLRGFQLYQMLKANSLLFEVYRDDIDTDMEDNDILTLNLSKFRRLKYCLMYTSYLFRKEARYLRNISDKNLYRDVLGNEIATSILMKGIKESIFTYYNYDSEDKDKLVNIYNSLAHEMNGVLKEIQINDNVDLVNVELL